MAKPQWTKKVGNTAQIGGIETSILDNGPGRGTRIAWINTGSSLRYKVVIDRAMDITDTFYNNHSLAWLSHLGTTAPRPDVTSGFEWLYTFGGGLLTTCGLSHVGAPDENNGLHGRISNAAAEVESIIQPDIPAGKLDMSITAIIKESRVFGPSLELRRTISSRIGQPFIKISDAVTNRGNASVPHMMLYHCNFGYPLVDAGADILWKGKYESRGGQQDDAIFNEKNKYRKVPAPLTSHKATGEAAGFIYPKPNTKGICTTGVCNRKLSMAAMLTFNKNQLPCLTNWQHFGPNEYVTGLEPGTNFPIGQIEAKKQKALVMLKPGQTAQYDLQLDVITGKKEIAALLKKF